MLKSLCCLGLKQQEISAQTPGLMALVTNPTTDVPGQVTVLCCAVSFVRNKSHGRTVYQQIGNNALVHDMSTSFHSYKQR